MGTWREKGKKSDVEVVSVLYDCHMYRAGERPACTLRVILREKSTGEYLMCCPQESEAQYISEEEARKIMSKAGEYLL